MDSTKRIVAGLISMTLAVVGGVALATSASAASCGFTAYDWSSSHARSDVNRGGLCSAQTIKAKYPVGSGQTFTSYGNQGLIWENVWRATSPAVPSGKSVIGSRTKLTYYGNITEWNATH